MKKYLTKNNILYTIIIIVFLSLSIIISNKHEHWTDEAIAWLIANDLSITEILKYMHCDGHPMLFHLIVKLFCFFGLKYNHFNIISILFSTLGVTILLFKSNFKWYIKILLPFTYYIFYQYTIVTRGYCIILLLLSLVATIYEKRIEKSYIYIILLILLTNLEAYTFLIAGSLYFLFILDYYNNYKKNKKHNIKHLTCIILLFLSFLFTTIYMFPRGDGTFKTGYHDYHLANSFLTTPFDLNIIIILVSVFLVIFFILIYNKTNKKTIIEASIIASPTLLFMLFKYANFWHFGIAFLLLIFLAWIHKLSKIKVFNIFLLITCIVQICWSISSSIYDYNKVYAPGEEVANFIKQYDYKNLNIYATDIYETSINPYFDKNIFINYQPEYRFFYWNKKNVFYTKSYKNAYLLNYLLNDDIDIYVSTSIQIPGIDSHYNEYIFPGATYFTTSIYEDMTCYVYVKKELDTK